MLGLVLLYFLGKAFYKLAEQHDRHKWGFGILGVVSYYAGTFIAGFIIAILYELQEGSSIDDVSDIQLSFMALPFGLLTCWGLYAFLKKQWNKKSIIEDSTILDDEFLN